MSFGEKLGQFLKLAILASAARFDSFLKNLEMSVVMFWSFIAILKLILNSKFSKISLGQSKPLGFTNIL